MHLGPPVGMHDYTQRHLNVYTMEVFFKQLLSQMLFCE